MSVLTYVLNGEVPPKKNHRQIVSNGRRMFSIPSQGHAKWHSLAAKQIALQGRPQTPINQAVRITCRFTHGDLRKRDHNNQMASVMDLLVDCGVLEDDNWFVVREEACFVKGYDPRRPCVDVEIDYIEGAEDYGLHKNTRRKGG